MFNLLDVKTLNDSIRCIKTKNSRSKRHMNKIPSLDRPLITTVPQTQHVQNEIFFLFFLPPQAPVLLASSFTLPKPHISSGIQATSILFSTFIAHILVQTFIVPHPYYFTSFPCQIILDFIHLLPDLVKLLITTYCMPDTELDILI